MRVNAMALETFPVDLAAFFESEEAQAELLNDALATGHAGYIANALGIIARARHVGARCRDGDEAPATLSRAQRGRQPDSGDADQSCDRARLSPLRCTATRG